MNVVESGLSTVNMGSVNKTERSGIVTRAHHDSFILQRDQSNLDDYQESHNKKFKVNLASNYDSILKMKSQ